MKPTRDDAFAVLSEFTKNPNLVKHALAVEAAMRAYAEKLGEDPEEWGITGLIHDFDYEQNPTEDTHVHVGVEILRERGWPEDWIDAMASHADFMNIPRNTPLRRALFAIDELTGFLVACTLVRPGKRLADLPVKSVRKKMKDKAFARSVNRDDIRQGAELLGLELNEHIAFVRDAMVNIADELGLAGS